eukprot:15234-Rhodomonas_salina.3
MAWSVFLSNKSFPRQIWVVSTDAGGWQSSSAATHLARVELDRASALSGFRPSTLSSLSLSTLDPISPASLHRLSRNSTLPTLPLSALDSTLSPSPNPRPCIRFVPLLPL